MIEGVKLQNQLLQKAGTLPDAPGCYLMKDSRQIILYVGKAKNLKKRVTSYFNSSPKAPRTEVMLSHVKDFDFLLTNTEAEAYVLENNLIKKYNPRYNVRLKDDKSYPYAVVDFDHPFPRLQYLRRPQKARNRRIFGPFPSGSNFSEVLRILIKSFRLRDCTDREFSTRKKPCLLYQIHQCSAPCVGNINTSQYERLLNLALSFFKGGGFKEALKFLEDEMHGFASQEEFEAAAILRDNIETLKSFLSHSYKQHAELIGEERSMDFVNFYGGPYEIDMSIYFMRGGILLGHKNYHFSSLGEDEIQNTVMGALLQYYTNNDQSLPKAIIVPFAKEELQELNDALSLTLIENGEENIPKLQFGGTRYQSLMNLVFENAKETQRVRKDSYQNTIGALNKLRELVKMKEFPQRIECYDIAVWQGKSPTASQVVMVEGRLTKEHYRYYHLEELAEGNNDFLMMQSLIKRRLNQKILPDLMVIDGGIGQVNAVKKILDEMDMTDIPVVGIAKSRSEKETEERLIIPGRSNSYLLHRTPTLMKLLVTLRDEAHRFCRKLHHKQENKRLKDSWLDQIEGIGPKTKQNILSHLDRPWKELTNMKVDKIAQILAIRKPLAQRIKDFLLIKGQEL
ncbi:MAG: excinuclease ABC subunit UvrC [Bacteriovoracia bacterium]